MDARIDSVENIWRDKIDCEAWACSTSTVIDKPIQIDGRLPIDLKQTHKNHSCNITTISNNSYEFVLNQINP